MALIASVMGGVPRFVTTGFQGCSISAVWFNLASPSPGWVWRQRRPPISFTACSPSVHGRRVKAVRGRIDVAFERILA